MAQKLKIAFDAKRLFNNFTGLGNYSRTLVRNLQKFYPEHEYHLFTPKLIENNETSEFLESSKFIIHKCPHSFGWYWRQFQITSELEKLDIDIYHGLSHELPVGIKNSKTKSVVSFHDLIYEKYPQDYSWIDRKTYRFKYKTSAQVANSVVAISDSTKSDLVKLYGINREKITVIYQTCHNSFIEQTQTTKNPTDFDRYFLYVGSVIPRKGLKRIVQAYAKIDAPKRIPLLIIGDGKGYKNECLELINNYKLENSILFQDYVSNDRLIDFYSNAEALIYPSIYEGFGIPIIEANMSGTQVITSNVSSMPEAASPDSILIDPSNIDALAKAIKSLKPSSVADKNKRREWSLQKFNPKVLSSQLMSHYRSLL